MSWKKQMKIEATGIQQRDDFLYDKNYGRVCDFYSARQLKDQRNACDREKARYSLEISFWLKYALFQYFRYFHCSKTQTNLQFYEKLK